MFLVSESTFFSEFLSFFSFTLVCFQHLHCPKAFDLSSSYSRSLTQKKQRDCATSVAFFIEIFASKLCNSFCASPTFKMVSAYFYIVFWISVSCTMILFNKAVLDQMKFPYPMFLTTWHMVFATCFTQIMSRTTNMLPGVREKKVDSKALQTSIFPVALCFAVSLVLSNKSYIYLSVSYIQVRLPCYLIVLHSLSHAHI